MRKILIILSILILFQSLYPSILISPVRFIFSVSPGKLYTDAIRVRNMAKARVYVKVYPSDFTINEEGTLSFYDPGTIENSVSPFIRINPTFFKLEPNQEKWVRFTVRMPENIKGELHGMIFFQTVPGGMEKAKGHQVFLSTRLGAVVYASTKGKIEKLAEISNFYLKENSRKGTIEYSIILENKGNVHIRPKGDLEIFNSKREKVFKGKMNEYGSPILRNKIRVFKGEIGKNFLSDKYKVIAEVDYGGKEELVAEKSINILEDVKIEDFKAEIIKEELGEKPAKVINDLKVENIEGGTIVKVMGDGKLDYSSLFLDNPPRLVVDIKGVDNKLVQKTISVDLNKITGIRTSQYQVYPEKIARIVIDLKNKVNYEILKDIKGINILLGNTQLIKEKINLSIPSKSRIIFVADVRGLKLLNGANKSFIKIRNLKGDIEYQINLKAIKKKNLIEFKGELEKIPKPGTYFAELVVFHNGITPLISYAKFAIEK